MASFIRDRLIKIANDKRGFLKASAEISQTPIAPVDLQDIGVLEAAADIAQFVISAGEAAKLGKVEAPEWVLRLAGQGRSALIQLDPD